MRPMDARQVADVIVVGGGAIGGAIALALADRGVSVTVLESGRIGQGASAAAAGALTPDRGDGDPPALTALAHDSLALWPEFAAELQGRTGVGLGATWQGLLEVWLDPDAAALPDELATGSVPPAGPGAEALSAAEVRELEPALTGPIVGGLLHRHGGQVDNPRLAPALLRAAGDLGARVVAGTPVASLLGSGGRCTGVRTASGLEFHSGAVVLAAGAWSGPLATASGIELPVEPWRGQMLAFDAPSRVVRHLVFCGELVLVPRPHGPLVVGTTLERVGFDTRVTLAGLTAITARAARVAPALGDLPLSKSWAGLRPGTPDHLPYLGPVPGWSGLFAATGHGRKGIILAPITGQLLARLVLDDGLDPRLIPCLPARVASGPLDDPSARAE